jgi:sulfur-oxidizing protein SoxX
MCSTLKLLLTGAILLFSNALSAADAMPPAEPYCDWVAIEYEIAKPLCGLEGNAERGKAIVSDSHLGNCVACHHLPIEEVSVFGTIGPDLDGTGSRYTGPQLRMRITDTKQINPMSIMPGFYRDPDLINRPAAIYKGRTFLTAQQVEDVVAYLKTLK